MTLKIGAKVGENNKIYGSVTALQIADALAARRERRPRKFSSIPTSHQDRYLIPPLSNLHQDVKAKVNFEVVAE